MDGELALRWCELILEYDGVSVSEVLQEKSRSGAGTRQRDGAAVQSGGNENLRELFRTMNNSNNEVQKENRRERAARYKAGKNGRRAQV